MVNNILREVVISHTGKYVAEVFDHEDLGGLEFWEPQVVVKFITLEYEMRDAR